MMIWRTSTKYGQCGKIRNERGFNFFARFSLFILECISNGILSLRYVVTLAIFRCILRLCAFCSSY